MTQAFKLEHQRLRNICAACTGGSIALGPGGILACARRDAYMQIGKPYAQFDNRACPCLKAFDIASAAELGGKSIPDGASAQADVDKWLAKYDPPDKKLSVDSPVAEVKAEA